MKVIVLGCVHDKYWETELFVKSCRQFFPTFDICIGCNTDIKNLKHLDCELLQIPDETTLDYSQVQRSSDYFRQVGALSTHCYINSWVSNKEYDYVILLATDCIFVTDVILNHIEEMKKHNYDYIMGSLRREPYGSNIRKGTTPPITLEMVLNNWNFNGEKTLIRILNNYNVCYVPMISKFGYLAPYGTIHYDTTVAGGKEKYMEFIKDGKFVYERNKFENWNG